MNLASKEQSNEERTKRMEDYGLRSKSAQNLKGFFEGKRRDSGKGDDPLGETRDGGKREEPVLGSCSRSNYVEEERLRVVL